MAMTLRLTDEETEALRATAAREGRSMQDVARSAITSYVTNRDSEIRKALAGIVARDAEILRRLAQ